MGNAGVTAAGSPKAFVSYSWTTVEHSERVRLLAERLMHDGVEIVLDQWDLRPGHDANVFMERSVADVTVTKVIIISDRRYAEKADARDGGVGTETLIMSPRVYANAQQDKFGIVVTEFDDEHKACVPTFLSGRIFFDFSSSEKQESSYEELLRWLHGKPKLSKPKVGKVPSYLDSVTASSSQTSSSARRIEQLLRTQNAAVAPAMLEYGDLLHVALREIKVSVGHTSAESIYQPIFDAIDQMSSYVTEFRNICDLSSKLRIDQEIVESICYILERIASNMFRDKAVNSWNEAQFDAHKYIGYECFMSLIAALLRYAKFEELKMVLDFGYYVEDQDTVKGPATQDYSIFRPYLRSFESWNSSLQQRFYSPVAEVLKKRNNLSIGLFDDFQQVDLLLYLRNPDAKQELRRWYPVTLVYATGRYKAFPFFARCESRRFFEKALPIFDCTSKDEFLQLLEKLAERGEIRSTWDTAPILRLANAEHIGSRP